MEVISNNYMPGDPRLVQQLVNELKSQGIFDQFRKECFADVDTKPAYQNLRQRVEGSVAAFLKEQTWSPDMNKNQVREQLKKNIYESGYLETGVERIVDQVVNPKINTVFLPIVEDVVYKYLGIEKPQRDQQNEPIKNTQDLLPKDLEAISPESVQSSKRDQKDGLELLNESVNSKIDEDESPPFEPLEGGQQTIPLLQEDTSMDSELSGISGLQSHESNLVSESKSSQMDWSWQDTQLSQNSSESKLSVVTSEEQKIEINKDFTFLKSVDSDCRSVSHKLEDDTDKTEDSVESMVIEDESTVDSQNHSKGKEDNIEVPITSEQKPKINKEDDLKKNSERRSSDLKREEKKKSDEKKSKGSHKHFSKDDKHRKSSSSKEKDKSSSRHNSSFRDRDNKDTALKDKEKNKDDSKSSRNKDSKTHKGSVERDRYEKDKTKEKDKYGKSKEKEDDKSSKEKNEKDKNKFKKEGSKDKLDYEKNKIDKERLSKDKSEKQKNEKEKTDRVRGKDRVEKDKSDKPRDKIEKIKDKVDKKDRDKNKNVSSSSNEKNSSSSSSNTRKESSSFSHSKKKDSEKESKSVDKHKKEKHPRNRSSETNKNKKRDSKKDDHYSSKEKKNHRRSFDRDSNDGQSGKNTSSNISENRFSNSQPTNRDSSSNSFSGSGDSGNSDAKEISSKNAECSGKQTEVEAIVEIPKMKYIKPKFALNFEEAKRIMKIRRQLAILERQNQLSLADLNIVHNGFGQLKHKRESKDTENRDAKTVDDIDTPKTSPFRGFDKDSVKIQTQDTVDAPKEKMTTADLNLQSIFLSKENWEALEARLEQEMLKINFNAYESHYDDFDDNDYSSITISPMKNSSVGNSCSIEEIKPRIILKDEVMKNDVNLKENDSSTSNKNKISERVDSNVEETAQIKREKNDDFFIDKTNKKLIQKIEEGFEEIAEADGQVGQLHEYVMETEEIIEELVIDNNEVEIMDVVAVPDVQSNVEYKNNLAGPRKKLSIKLEYIRIEPNNKSQLETVMREENEEFIESNMKNVVHNTRPNIVEDVKIGYNINDYCTHFEKPDDSVEKKVDFLNKFINKLESNLEYSLKEYQNNILPDEHIKIHRRGRKRKFAENVDLKNNNKLNYEKIPEIKRRGRRPNSKVTMCKPGLEKFCKTTDISLNESFSLPLSPAESDKSIDKKEDSAIPIIQRKITSKTSTPRVQRYSSDDLYKPRTTITSTRRSKREKKP